MAVNPDFASKSDNELVRLTLENPDDFLYIVNRYRHKLLSFIRRISNVGPEEAEDLLQEVFIKVYQNLNDVNPNLKFSSWIYRITRNQVISHYRKNKNRPPVLSFEFNEEIFENFAADFDITKQIDNQILKQNITKALSQMPPKYREVMILKYLEEKNYSEISDILKRPPGTVATLLNRGKKQFKKIYGH